MTEGKPQEQCPHCGNEAVVRPAGPGRFKCAICGGPRIPMDDEKIARSFTETPLLREARSLANRRIGWWFATGLSAAAGMAALLGSLVLSWAAEFGLTGNLTLLVMTALPLLGSFLALQRARTSGSRSEQLIDQAWTRVAGEVMQNASGPVTAARLGQLLRVDDARALELYAQADVEHYLRSTRSEPRLRVAEEGAEPGHTELMDEVNPEALDLKQRR